MYAFSPLVGRYADRHPRFPAIFLGSAVLTVWTVLAALSGDVENLLIGSVPSGERVGAQGAADLVMSFCVGLAGFGSAASAAPAATTSSPALRHSPSERCSTSPTPPRQSTGTTR